ncbi:restriction endonuclease [Marinifilum flexuosum]|uniref:restriction endonuclease n=1 Tax=Marinifilum flexuosum TaxID=1117708 RepID=UPI002494F919|nr:restriction endonuclease [Marinifilum flexuosum]
MNIENIKEKIEGYSDEVKELHPFLKNLFSQMPQIRRVEYNHGSSEYGADFLLVEEDQTLLKEVYIGVVVKSKKIQQKDVDEIERQIKEAFRMPKIIHSGEKKVTLNKVWLLTNKTITSNAKEKIQEYFKDKHIDIIDVDLLISLVGKYYPQFIEKMKADIFTINNRHISSCGTIPEIDKKDKYLGYFENEYGEQTFFIGDYKDKSAVIRGGDFGWETEIKISLGMQEFNYIFNQREILWISNCFATMLKGDFIKIYEEFLGILGFPKIYDEEIF